MCINISWAHHWVKYLADWVDLYLSGIHKLLRQAAPFTTGKLLDVGCGRKPYEFIFHPYINEYIGIEYKDTYALTADSETDDVADYYYDGNILPFENNSFDTVISISVLEHTPTPSKLFQEMTRVLKPGGKMVLHVPFSFRLHEEPHDYYRFTRYALLSLCAEHGLLVHKIVAQGTLWTVIGHKITTYLAFHVAHMGQFAQSLNKLGMEKKQSQGIRFWTLPLVVPTIFTIVICVRILERFITVSDDCLAFMLIAEKMDEKQN